MERDILKKAAAFFAKQSRVKFAFIAGEEGRAIPSGRCAGV